MANTKIKSGISNKRARITANDLSLLNGISEKINEEYLKNIREIISYNIAEQVRDGHDVVNIDIPYIGELTISRKTLDNNQKKLADIIREYNTYIRKHFITAAILNKDPVNAEDFIVTSERTDAAFDSGQDEEVKMFE